MATEIKWHSCTIDKETHIPTLKMTIDGQNIELDFPPVDFVEVVRCKDCNNWMYEYDDVGLCVTDVPDVDGVQRLAFDFCSYGERKTDG